MSKTLREEYVSFLDATADHIRGHLRHRQFLKAIYIVTTWAIITTLVLSGVVLKSVFDEKSGLYEMTVAVFDTSSVKTVMHAKRLASIHEEFRVVKVFSTDSTKTWDRWKNTLGLLENSGSYNVNPVRPNSKYLGLYQIDSTLLPKLGIQVSAATFIATPELQEAALKLLVRENMRTMEPFIRKYENRIINNVQITASGILAMTHQVGPDSTKQFLISEGKFVPCDGNGPASNYLDLGGYDLSEALNVGADGRGTKSRRP